MATAGSRLVVAQLLDEADRPGHEQGRRNALVRHVAYRDIQQPVAAVVAVEVAPHRAGGLHPGPEAEAIALLAGLAAMGQHRHLYFPGGIQFTLQPAAPGSGGLKVGNVGLEVPLHGGEGVHQPRHLIVAPGRRQRRFQVAAGDAVARLRQVGERPGKPARHHGHGGGHQQQGEQPRQCNPGFVRAQGRGHFVFRVEHTHGPAGGRQGAQAHDAAARGIRAVQLPIADLSLQGGLEHLLPVGQVHPAGQRVRVVAHDIGRIAAAENDALAAEQEAEPAVAQAQALQIGMQFRQRHVRRHHRVQHALARGVLAEDRNGKGCHQGLATACVEVGLHPQGLARRQGVGEPGLVPVVVLRIGQVDVLQFTVPAEVVGREPRQTAPAPRAPVRWSHRKCRR